MADEYVTLTDAAAELGLSRWSLSDRLQENGIIKHRRGINKRVRWLRRADVEHLKKLLDEAVAVAEDSGAAS